MVEGVVVAKNQAEVGTLYLDDEGLAYRLLGFGFDWDADTPETREVPDYAVHYPSGGSGETHRLPESAVVVWTPPRGEVSAPSIPMFGDVQEALARLVIRTESSNEKGS